MNRRRWPLFLLLLAGCPPRVDVRSVPPPDATALLAEVDAVDAHVARLQSQAKARVDARGKKGNVQLFVAAAAPASVHLEVLDFFGKPSGILISDGQRFVMFASDAGVWQRGAATAENVARVLPVSLPPEQLVAMLLGRAPRLADPAPTLAVDAEENLFRVTLHEGRPDPAAVGRPRPQAGGAEPAGGPWRLHPDLLGASRTCAARRSRRAITFAGEGSVALQYTDLRLGEQPDASLFVPEPPPGVPVEQIGTRGSLP